ncbi:MAG: hypothetical protein JSW14_05665 [Candidatus Bathyarchaeum sp.]|nr:MAG: hypothetical protein JSW14_05665 [Candidatus Bathyarchaeum sp.]
MMQSFFICKTDKKKWGIYLVSCPSCGYDEASLKPLLCKVCGKEGCKECMTYLFSFFQYGIEPQFHENWYCHSNQCYEIFADKIENSIEVDILDRDKFGIGLLRGVFYNAVKNPENHFWLRQNVPHSLSLDDFLFVNANFELVSRVEEYGKKLVNKKVGKPRLNY